jgi:hypothetical protein
VSGTPIAAGPLSAAPARVDHDADDGGRAAEGGRPRAGLIPWLLTGVAAALGCSVFLAAYNLHHMQPVGWDIFGYIWQTAVIGHAPLSGVGTRPGLPLLGSILGSITTLSPTRELVVLPVVLVAALALAAASTVRTALRLPSWLLPLIVATVLAWPGTGRTIVGYEASLLLLVLVAAAAGILVQARGRFAPLVITAVLFFAAALTHAAIFAAFAAAATLYVALSVPAFLRERHAGASLLATDAGGAVATFLAGGVAAAGVLFGALGFRPADTVHTQSVSFLFRGRTLTEIRRIRPPAMLPAAAVGAAASWRCAESDRSGRALARLGLAWLVVVGVGVLLSLRGRAVPGGRFLLFALPLPLLIALGIGAVAWIISGGRLGLRALLAVALVVATLATLARPGYQFIRYQYVQTRATLSTQLGAVATYSSGLGPDTPVVVVIDQPGSAGAFTPKLRLNVIRSAMPADRIVQTFVFPGRVDDLLAGRPTILPATTSWERAFNRTSQQAWTQVGPALTQGAAVLVMRRYDEAGFDQLAAKDSSRLLTPDIFVVRGPVRTIPPVAPRGGFGVAAAALWALVLLAGLGLVGWGFAAVALPAARASWLDVASLAPAVGAGIAVVGSLLVAVAGLDPSGPWGLGALLVAALVGWALFVRTRRMRRPGGPGTATHSPGEEPGVPVGGPSVRRR